MIRYLYNLKSIIIINHSNVFYVYYLNRFVLLLTFTNIYWSVIFYRKNGKIKWSRVPGTIVVYIHI